MDFSEETPRENLYFCGQNKTGIYVMLYIQYVLFRLDLNIQETISWKIV